MSAALVESVRDTVDAEESVEIHRVHGTPGVPPLALISRAQMLRAKLDLPAILAALTEGESLRAQVVAGQAREVALREALAKRMRHDENAAWPKRLAPDLFALYSVLSEATDTAALKAFGLRVIAESDKWGEDLPESIVDRVLGGS